MNKARRQELKMLKYKKRLKNLKLKEGPNKKLYAFRSHGKPCSCHICSHSKYQRSKEKENVMITLEVSKIEVIGWISYDESEKYLDNNAGGLGGWVEGENFETYLKERDPFIRPYLTAIKNEVIAKNIRFTGDYHQQSDMGVPLFNDKTISTFSYRAWGDLMAAIWNSEENTDKYSYMDFYM